MRRILLFSSTVFCSFVFLIINLQSVSAQGDHKYFLGECYTGNPDNSVKRDLRKILWDWGYGPKFENFAPIVGHADVYFGNPDIIALGYDLTVEYSHVTYINMHLGNIQGGIGPMLGRNLFPKSDNRVLNGFFISAGAVFDWIALNDAYKPSNLAQNNLFYNVNARVQLLFKYPRWYVLNKRHPSIMWDEELSIKFGYDFTLLQGRLQTSTDPSQKINTSGFYITLGTTLREYWNKELFKKERKKTKK
jgi:hypothetical protein